MASSIRHTRETSGWKPSRVPSFSKSCWSWFSSRCLNDWRGRETQALLAFIVLRCRGHCFEAHFSKSKLNSQNGTQGSESFTKEARRPSVSLRRSRWSGRLIYNKVGLSFVCTEDDVSSRMVWISRWFALGLWSAWRTSSEYFRKDSKQSQKQRHSQLLGSRV